VRDSHGAALAAPESELINWTRRAAAAEGISFCPETAACLAVLDRLVEEGSIRSDEEVVVFNTGAAQKYVEALSADLPCLPPIDRIDWDLMASDAVT